MLPRALGRFRQQFDRGNIERSSNLVHHVQSGRRFPIEEPPKVRAPDAGPVRDMGQRDLAICRDFA